AAGMTSELPGEGRRPRWESTVDAGPTGENRPGSGRSVLTPVERHVPSVASCRIPPSRPRKIRGSTMTVIKATAVQLSPVLYSREGTVEKVCRQILALGREGVQFATFPETVVPYYPYFSFVQPPFRMAAEHHRLLEQAVTIPSAATQAIGEACKQAGVVVSIGVNERDGGTLYNAQLLFDADGRLLQHRRKISPTYHERMVWGQGDGSGLRAVDSAVGRIGSLACWEHYNPL